MAQLVTHITGAQWERGSPSTPVQRFFKQYVDAADGKGYDTGSGLKFYSKDAIFHNQNGAVYHGGDEMGAWMKKLFGVFERIHHDRIYFVEIALPNGDAQIYTQNVRNLWIRGNTGEEPTVSIPVTMIAVIGESGTNETPEGMHFTEAWLYWDTALLLPHLPNDAVVFKMMNILEEDHI